MGSSERIHPLDPLHDYCKPPEPFPSLSLHPTLSSPSPENAHPGASSRLIHLTDLASCSTYGERAISRIAPALVHRLPLHLQRHTRDLTSLPPMPKISHVSLPGGAIPYSHPPSTPRVFLPTSSYIPARIYRAGQAHVAHFGPRRTLDVSQPCTLRGERPEDEQRTPVRRLHEHACVSTRRSK